MKKNLSLTKYKDSNPLNTIQTIRKILFELRIIAVETSWNNSVDDYYSVRLEIPETLIGVNGKGTTYLYALASAYGELMERLQNFTQYRLSIDLDPSSIQNCDFYYAPDEKYYDTDEYINSNYEWFESQVNSIESDVNLDTLMEAWNNIYYEDIPCDIVALPYANLCTNNISYIPIKMVSKLYMSNGMCAGNTKVEAMVQGLSEIFERYVNRQILSKEITPPNIPEQYISKYPRIKRMIDSIKEDNNYEVLLKDCSLGEGYPVVAVIFINRQNQSYFVKFGSHPLFEIAAERTLTELLQGQELNYMKGLTKYQCNINEEIDSKNIMNILVNGIGYYPMSFFNDTPSYDFKPFPLENATSNTRLLNYQLNLLQLKKHNLYVRDVSFLGFPSYHLIVPGLSEVEYFDDIDSLKEYTDFLALKSNIRNNKYIEEKHMLETVQILNKNNYHLLASISKVLGLNDNKLFPWYFNSIGLFSFALYYTNDNFLMAYIVLKNWIKTIENNDKYKNILVFLNCLLNYIGMKKRDMNTEDIESELLKFYDKSIVNNVIYEFDKSKLFIESFQCWDCNSCKYNLKCKYPKTKELYNTLKCCYKENNINQLNLVYSNKKLL